MGIAGSVSLLVTSISDINLRNLVSARMSMDEQQLYASLSKTIGEEPSCKGNLNLKLGIHHKQVVKRVCMGQTMLTGLVM